MIKGWTAAWREVTPIMLGLAVFLLAAFWWQSPWLALLAAVLLLGVSYFFRDPERTPLSLEPQVILSPADGRVMAIEKLENADFLSGPGWRIIIFLSLFDVHVQRTPFAGQVQLIQYQPGSFVPAYRVEAHSNEANLIGLETRYGLLAVRQVSGILARRIVCWVKKGEALSTGQRLGLIKFGSRVDLLLPPDVEILAQTGQRLHGGETVVARWSKNI